MTSIFPTFSRGAAVVFALLAAGCGAGPPKDAPGVVTLEFFNYASPEFLELYNNKLIPAFERANPGIKVRTITDLGNTSYDAKLMTLMAGKIPPDLIHVTQQNFPFYAVKDAVLPLDDFIKEDAAFNASDYYPEVMRELRYEERQLGLPSDFSTIIFFYNKDLFTKYGVAPPTPDWTWEDFLAAARALTRDTDGDGHTDLYGFSNPSSYNRWPAWVWMNGGDILSRDGKECVMDSPAAVGGLEFYVNLSLKEKVAPTPGQSLGQDFEDMFASQRVAMIADSRFAYKRFVKTRRLKFNWDAAPMPRGKEQATTFIWGANCIMRSTKHPKEAWKFLKFLSGPEAARINAEAGNALPALKSAAEEAVNNPAPGTPEHDRYFLDAVSYGRTAPFPPQFAEYNAAMVGLQDAFLGLTPVDKAARDFTRDVNELLHGGVF
jgi:multiple sugar transport system substrate-binding protein